MSLRMRPRFGLTVVASPDAVMDHVRAVRGRPELGCKIQLLDRQLEVSVPPAERHFWSPFLNILVEDGPEGGAALRGQFGPNANVWSLFLAGYAIVSITGAMGLVLATSQLQLGGAPVGFVVAGACLVAGVMIWGAGQVGQRLARAQMVALHRRVIALLGELQVSDVVCEPCGMFPEE